MCSARQRSSEASLRPGRPPTGKTQERYVADRLSPVSGGGPAILSKDGDPPLLVGTACSGGGLTRRLPAAHVEASVGTYAVPFTTTNFEGGLNLVYLVDLPGKRR